MKIICIINPDSQEIERVIETGAIQPINKPCIFDTIEECKKYFNARKKDISLIEQFEQEHATES